MIDWLFCRFDGSQVFTGFLVNFLQLNKETRVSKYIINISYCWLKFHAKPKL